MLARAARASVLRSATRRRGRRRRERSRRRDLDVEVQVTHHPLHDRHLLRVLLAEERELGADDVEELQHTVATARKCPGRCAPERRRALDLDPGLEAGGTPRPRSGRRGRRRRPRARAPRRAPRRAGSRRGSPRRSNWAGFTNSDATTTSAVERRRERANRRGTLPSSARARRSPGGARARRAPMIERTTFTARSPPRARRREARARASPSGSPRDGVRPSPQSPRSIGPVSSKPFSIVRRISGSSASGAPPPPRRPDATRWSVTR